MQQFKDANGNEWGDFAALSKKTKISPKTAAAWVADGIFKAGVHYAKPDDGRDKIFYRLDLCADVHRVRLAKHKANLKAGKYLKKPSDSSSASKKQVNITLEAHELATLERLQSSGQFMRFKEMKCGDIVLRSEAQVLSISAIAGELLRRSLQSEVVKMYEQHLADHKETEITTNG